MEPNTTTALIVRTFSEPKRRMLHGEKKTYTRTEKKSQCMPVPNHRTSTLKRRLVHPLDEGGRRQNSIIGCSKNVCFVRRKHAPPIIYRAIDQGHEWLFHDCVTHSYLFSKKIESSPYRETHVIVNGLSRSQLKSLPLFTYTQSTANNNMVPNFRHFAVERLS